MKEFLESSTTYLSKTLGIDFGPPIAMILILVIGFIICKLIAKGIELALGRTNLDEKLADVLDVNGANTERLIGKFVFWILMLFVLVAALGAGGMGEEVTAPLNELLGKIGGYIPNLLGAAIFGAIVYAVAYVVKKILQGVLNASRLDERLGLEDGKPISLALVNILFFGILVYFLPAFLTKLGVPSAAEPITKLTNEIMGFAPQIFTAAIILAVGGFLAWMVHKMLGSALDAVGFDKLPQKFGHEGELKFLGKPLSDMIAYVVMISIIVVCLAEAMGKLQLEQIQAVAELLKNVWGGIILFLIGMFAAGIAKKAIAKQSEFWGKVGYAAILVFFAGMALQTAKISVLSDSLVQFLYMGLIAAATVAFGIGGAIALGLGGREAVQKFLDKKTGN